MEAIGNFTREKMKPFFDTIVTKLSIRKGSASVAGFDECEVAFDVASQCGTTGSSTGKDNGQIATSSNDESLLDSVSACRYVSEARKETSTVDWKLKDFLCLNKVYMLDPGPNIIVDTGKTIDLPIKWKFSLESVYSTSETRSHIWLVTEIIDAPAGVENVVCKFSTLLLTDGVKVKEVHGCPVTIPANRKWCHVVAANNKKFNVTCLFPWDCVYSTERLLTVRIQISLFSRKTQGTSEVTNVKETMEKSANAFSLQIGSLLRSDEEERKVFSDVRLILKDEVTVHAHKAILGSRSPVFKAMLLADMEESKSGIIRIPDVGSKAMGVLLHHMYTGKVDPSCNQVLEEVIYAAGKYNLPELVEYCDKIMITVCDNENALELLKLAKMHNLRNAVRDITNYVKMNSGEILDNIIED